MTYDDGVSTIRYGSKQVEFVMWDLSGKQLNSLIHKFVSPYHLFHKNEMKIKFFYPIISLLIYAGCSEYDGLRVQLYRDTDLFLVCFDIGDTDSLDAAIDNVSLFLVFNMELTLFYFHSAFS